MRSTARACDYCGAPAAYTERDGRRDLCEECARYWGAEANGAACAAFETLGFAISLARGADVTDDQIRQAVEMIMTHPHSDGNYPIGGDMVLARDHREDRLWARSFEAVAS